MERSDAITPEMAEKILSADYRNIVRKVSEGKPLSVAERDLIKAKASTCADSLLYAQNFEQLAMLLGVSVRTINRWRKLEGAPEPQPDGSVSVIEWRRFVQERQLKGQGSPQIEALKARKLLAEIEDRELKVALKKGLYLLKAEVEEQWTRRFAVLKTLLYSKFTLELPPLCVGKDAFDLMGMFQDALDNTLREAAEAANAACAS